MPPFVRAIGVGLIGSLVGAGVWGAIAYFAHREVGFIAWGVGFLTGFAVRLGAQESVGSRFGVAAVVLALVGLLGGKFLAVHFMVQDALAQVADKLAVTEQTMIDDLADEVAGEWQAKKKQTTLPGPKPAAPAGLPKGEFAPPPRPNYTPAVLAEAKKRWQALGADEQRNQIAERNAQLQEVMGALGGNVKQQGFVESFTPFDFLWFGLASLTAFRLGKGEVPEGQERRDADRGAE